MYHTAAFGRTTHTSGAGPSHTCASHKVTLKEIEDEDASSIAYASSASDSTLSVTGKGKKKAVSKKKKKKRTKVHELGVEVDDLKRLSKKDEKRRACRRSSGNFDLCNVEHTPPGFKSGGYLELMHGHHTRRAP
ncbi:hypothetical protein FRC12_013825 [Ceratobasidium sp. 428]|nr:hypothetical protein FRC12_013825 [Ceratobasidium sp. 428]